LPPTETSLLVAAAGTGVRMSAGEHKSWMELAGKPLLWHTLRRACLAPEIDLIILLVHPEKLATAQKAVGEWRFEREIRPVAGGNLRQYTIFAGLRALPAECRTVAVHDAARPFASPGLFSRVIEAAKRAGAATAAVPPSDTVVKVDDTGRPEYLDRARLRLIQTPQAFRREIIERAHAKAAESGVKATDDASLVRRMGLEVELVEGEISNFKITYPEDITRAETVIKNLNP